MSHATAPTRERMWFDSSHASLCALGAYLRQIAFFGPLEARLHLKHKLMRNPKEVGGLASEAFT